MSEQIKTLIESLFKHAECAGDSIAYSILLPDGTYHFITYNCLLDRVISLSSILKGKIPVDEPVGLLYPTSIDYIIALFACLCSGVIAIPLNPPRTARSFYRIRLALENSGAKVVLSTAKLVEQAKVQQEKEEWLREFEWIETNNIISYGDCKKELIKNRIAFLQYTSGSIGNPKGVVVTHRNLVHNHKMIKKAMGIEKGQSIANWLPIHHDMGLVGNILFNIYMGTTCFLIAPDEFLRDPLQWLRLISDNRVHLSGAPNFAYELCVQALKAQSEDPNLDLSCWGVAYCGAEPIRAETIEKVQVAFQKFKFTANAFYPCYGLAEGTLFVSGKDKGKTTRTVDVKRSALSSGKVILVDSSEVDRRRVVSCGHSWDDLRIAIVNTTDLCEVDENHTGEIWLRGQNIADGYWKNSEESSKCFGAYLSNGDGPFLRTGDIGFVLDSNLYVTGRSSDIIIIRGTNYYPHDIENSVRAIPEALVIDECMAFSIDDSGSEELSLICEIRRTFRKSVDFNDLADKICHAIAADHGLNVHSILFVMPYTIMRTSSGKIRRRASKAAYLTGELDHEIIWSRVRSTPTDASSLSSQIPSYEGIFAKMKTCSTDEERAALLKTSIRIEVMRILRIVNQKEFDDQRGFWEMGMDSLSAAELRNVIQVMVGKPIPSTVIFNNPDLEMLVNYILRDLLEFSSPKDLLLEKEIVSGHVDKKSSIDDLSEAQIEALLLEELKSDGCIEQSQTNTDLE